MFAKRPLRRVTAQINSGAVFAAALAEGLPEAALAPTRLASAHAARQSNFKVK